MLPETKASTILDKLSQGNIEDMLREHKRHNHQAVLKARLDKDNIKRDNKENVLTEICALISQEPGVGLELRLSPWVGLKKWRTRGRESKTSEAIKEIEELREGEEGDRLGKPPPLPPLGQSGSSLAKQETPPHLHRSRLCVVSRSCLAFVRFCVPPGYPSRRSVLSRHVPLPASRGRLPEALRHHSPPLKITRDIKEDEEYLKEEEHGLASTRMVTQLSCIQRKMRDYQLARLNWLMNGINGSEFWQMKWVLKKYYKLYHY
ncbi:hypothetical protein PIB30_066019 [Stylosanthes scabra]|uniref:Uncharacterized protein n=1 Tax=Stylosanthes scabra TaxID=79078 RepID=A0ABU6YKC2_9FABA|nr:hypothetical protein [Stylosanthes scabra]